jgi:LmbE family N-acetylglucosaminyl deacetylase
MEKSKVDTPYQALLISDDAHGGQNIFDWLSDKIKITYVDNEKLCENLLNNTLWDLIILNAVFLKNTFQARFKYIPRKNQWCSFLIIADSSNESILTEYLSPYAVCSLHNPLNKNHFITLSLNLAKIAHQKRLQSQKIILAIGAHPDDIEIGCGGYLAALQEEGHSLNFLTLSLGNLGGKKEVRKQESILAAKQYQAKLYLKDLKDTCIANASKTISVIEEVVNRVQPTHIFTHSIHDTHQDHRNTHLACIVGCRSISNVNCYQSPSSTVDFKPSLFIDISHHIKTKLCALQCYKSQSEIRPYLERNFIYATAKYWGRYVNYHLAEPYEIIKMRGGYTC